MTAWLHHVTALPIVVPLLSAAVLLFFSEPRRLPRALIALASTLIQAAAAGTLLWMTSHPASGAAPDGILVYSIGSWPAPYGIVLVADRLAAVMLALTAAIALPVVVYSFAQWDRLGVYYHPLFQLLLMGVNGAFLTGDLFNLFVFFEILLAASYGLLMHGGGTARVTSSLHYIAVNLAASLIFLIGVAVIYGAAGTLNLADLAAHWDEASPQDRRLLDGGLAVLAVAFLIKGGIWPLNFWLPTAYSAAAAPVVAVFSILTKVGVYSIVRVGFMVDPSKPVLYGGSLLFAAAIATMAVGSLGALAARHPPRLIAFSVIVSAGTVLAALALGSASTLAPALFYLVISAPATAAAFLVAGMAARMQMHSVTAVLDRDGAEATYTAFDVGEPARSSASMDDDEVGFIIPAGVAFLGLAFLSCGLLVAGLPPLAGFLAKVSLIVAALGSLGVVQHPAHVWVLVVALLGASLAALLAFLRIGVRLFWTARETTRPRVRMLEAVPVAFLVLVGIGLTVMAGPVMTYLTAAARALHQPDAYIHAVLATSKPVQP